jgi:PAS domain S-box-containing protein
VTAARVRLKKTERKDRHAGDSELRSFRAGAECIATLVALRPKWAGASPARISRSLINTLYGALTLDLVYVCMANREDTPIQEARSTSRMNAGRIDAALRAHLGENVCQWPRSTSAPIGNRLLSVATLPLNLAGQNGVLVAASHRSDFPTKNESSALEVAASQLLLVLHEALRLKEQAAGMNFQATIDLLPILVAVTTPNHEVEALNQYALDYCGRTLDELKGHKLMDLIHPDDLERVLAAQRDLPSVGGPNVHAERPHPADGSHPFQLQYRVRRFDGAYRWFLSNAHPVKDASGRIVRWYSLLTNIDDRKRAEEALAASERDLRLIVDTIPAGAALMSSTGEFQVINEHLRSYFGWTIEQLPRWGNRDLVHPDDLPRSLKAFNHSIATGEPFYLEQRQRRFDGTYRWFQVHVRSILDASGKIARWNILHIDIDDRKRAEEALIASERNARLIVDSIPGLVAVHSASGEVETVNSQILEYYGATLDEIKNWSAGGFTHPEDNERSLDAFRQTIATGKWVEQEVRAKRHDGVYRWVQSRGASLKDADGRIIRWYNLIVDIDERKRAEETLKSREKELRHALAQLTVAQQVASMGSFTSDLIADEHVWSDEFYRICEFEPGSRITLQRVQDIVHPEDGAQFNSMIDRSYAGKESVFGFRILTRSGVQKYLRGFARRIEHSTKEAMFIGAMQDVTAEKLAAQDLNRARSELAHLSRVMTLGTLTASIAHEINQPLAGIVMNVNTCLSMLAADPPNLDGARATAQRTLRDSNRASEVIKRLRTLFSRNEPKSEPVDLNDAAREVLNLASTELQGQGVTVRTEFAESLPVVKGDRVQLQQVILNLVLNAADAMSEVADRPRVLIVTSTYGPDSVQCSVSDTGVGVDEKNLEKLFEAFHTTKSHGMGVGLSISQTIIENHEGRLWASPNQGPGATFSFSVPTIRANCA